jgi:PadR family transcriptional regulator PadR
MPRDRKPSRQTLRLLAVLCEQPKVWRHGYELARGTSLKSGTLYPLLMRLSERELLDAKWQLPGMGGGSPRHMYRLTTKGLSYARMHAGARAPSALHAARGRA